MEPLEPTDLEIATLVRKDVKLSVDIPDGFQRFSANGSTVLFADGCAVVVTPITPEFASKCAELHAAGGISPQEQEFGSHSVSRYNSPGNKLLFYLAVDDVDLQLAIDPADSSLALESLPRIITSIRVAKKYAR